MPSRRPPARTEPMPRQRGRLFLATLFSLLLHALILSLAFGGGEGLGLPSLTLPWQQRIVEAPSLRAVLQPARHAASAPALMPSPAPASSQATLAAGPAKAPSRAVSSRLRQAEIPIAPESSDAPPEAESEAETVTPADAIAAPTEPQAEMPIYAMPAPMPHTAVIALEQSDDKRFVVPPPPPEPESDTAAWTETPPQESVASEAQHEEEDEPRQIEPDRREPLNETNPADSMKADQGEAARQEAERREAERLAAEKLEAKRQEAARQDAARAEAARQEAERREAERLAAEKLEAQRQESARQDAARAEAARLQEAKEEDERRLARRRAMGRQLDEEAAQREAAAARPPLPLSLSTARRVRLWGRSDPNVELVLYAESWVRRIQLNTPVDTVRKLAGRRHTAPMVTVAIRSDGSVEAVTVVVSSGAPEIDEAIRRIVQDSVPYPPFSPILARQYDVIEIRRTWHFDTAIRLD